MGLLDGKVVIVTGAAQGMGRSHALRCVTEGASVTMTDIRPELPDDLAAQIGSVHLGERRLAALVSEFGARTVTESVTAIRFGRAFGSIRLLPVR